MTLSRLNANHVRSEDRLLLRISTQQDEEYRLWLAQLVTTALLVRCGELLQQSLASELPPAEASAVSEFRQEALQDEQKAGGFQPARRLSLGTEPPLVVNAHPSATANSTPSSCGWRRGANSAWRCCSIGYSSQPRGGLAPPPRGKAQRQ